MQKYTYEDLRGLFEGRPLILTNWLKGFMRRPRNTPRPNRGAILRLVFTRIHRGKHGGKVPVYRAPAYLALKTRSIYKPHGSRRERMRRVRQVDRGIIAYDQCVWLGHL